MNNKKYSVKQGYIVREIAGEYIAVPVDASCGKDIVIFNPVSYLLWQELQSEKTFDELLDVMLKNYDISKEEAEKDLSDFLAELEGNNLIN